MDKLNKTEKANTYTVPKNYYTLQENDELLEAGGRKLSRLTSYDAQKRLDHCSKRGEPRKTSFLSYPDLITAHQLIFCNAETLHNTLHPLLRSGLFSLTQQFSSIVHRDHYSATTYFLHYTTFYFIVHRCIRQCAALVSTKKKYRSLQQLLYPSTAIIH
ncbi:hypothetical protein T09_9546 [Trichinella sp. T9]|nr:hypothetical protein T09_9546 [Trichinella sp. T9]